MSVHIPNWLNVSNELKRSLNGSDRQRSIYAITGMGSQVRCIAFTGSTPPTSPKRVPFEEEKGHDFEQDQDDEELGLVMPLDFVESTE
jgi:hypothetical protein